MDQNLDNCSRYPKLMIVSSIPLNISGRIVCPAGKQNQHENEREKH